VRVRWPGQSFAATGGNRARSLRGEAAQGEERFRRARGPTSTVPGGGGSERAREGSATAGGGVCVTTVERRRRRHVRGPRGGYALRVGATTVRK
jgi:hypothetical protein